MEVGSFGVLDMSDGQVYPKTIFGPMFYSWWNCPLTDVFQMGKPLNEESCSSSSSSSSYIFNYQILQDLELYNIHQQSIKVHRYRSTKRSNNYN